MAYDYFPFDAGAGSDVREDDWRKMAGMWLPSGVDWGYLNKLECLGDSSGMQVMVKTGRAWASGHYVENDAQFYQAIASNSSGNPRIDRIVFRVDRTANTAAVAVVQGTPAATPTAPALADSAAMYELPLAAVAVANGAATITAANVTDERKVSIGIDGSSGSMVKLADSVVTGAIAMISILGLPQTFSHLHIRGRIRCGAAVAAVAGARLRLNGDAATNYESQQSYSSTTTVAAARQTGQGSVWLGDAPATTATAGMFAAITVDIPDYAGKADSIFKNLWGTMVGGTGSGATTEQKIGTTWFKSPTEGIKDLLFFDSGGANQLAIGSHISVYGIR